MTSAAAARFAEEEPEEEEEEEEQRPTRSDVNPSEALDRAIRRKLAGTDRGDLPYDLAAAVVDAASEVLIGQDEVTVAELNELFSLRWSEPHWYVTFADPRDGLGDIAGNLYSEDELLSFLMCTVASDWSALGISPEGTATMMSHGGIGLYDFTVDDGVYFFVLAERDVCDSEWWFAHAVNDMETRAEAIRSAEGAYAISEDGDDDPEW